MNWGKNYFIPGNGKENLMKASELSRDERNTHHNRARMLAGLGFILMLTIIGFPVGYLVAYMAMREANKAEEKRQSANG